VFPAIGWRSGWTTALASLELRPPLQSMAGGGRQARTRRTRQAPVGFLPLQRMGSRRSTNPGVPLPGSFPSQRFSRSQGFSPSRTVAGLFHPAGAHGVPPASRPPTSGSRRIRVLETPQATRLRRASQPVPALSGHPGGRTDGRGNGASSGRNSVFGARARGFKPSTRNDDLRRVEPQAIISLLSSGKPVLPTLRRHQPEGRRREEPVGESAQARRLRFSPKARDRTAPPRPPSQQRFRAPRTRGKPRDLLARPALPQQANSLTRARYVGRTRNTPDDQDAIRSSRSER
jgi:hypothetical protein